MPRDVGSSPASFCILLRGRLWGSGGAPATWHIGITKCVVTALAHLLAVACDGVGGVTCIDFHTNGNGQGRLVFQPSGIPCKADDIDLLETIRSSGFGPVALIIVYSEPSEVDCASVEPVQQ